jgi:hypothetical protein
MFIISQQNEGQLHMRRAKSGDETWSYPSVYCMAAAAYILFTWNLSSSLASLAPAEEEKTQYG